MPMRKNKEKTAYINAAPRVQRWLLCQQIGVAFYDSELPLEQLEQMREYFVNSDFLKDEIFKKTFK